MKNFINKLMLKSWPYLTILDLLFDNYCLTYLTPGWMRQNQLMSMQVVPTVSRNRFHWPLVASKQDMKMRRNQVLQKTSV